MSIDERFIKALHVETLRKQDLHAEREPHVIFQTSTIDALLDGAYDGEVTFGQLREHGDLGLGTLEACDGEMIAVGGEFFRAAVDGSVSAVPDSETTPFAVVTFFERGFAPRSRNRSTTMRCSPSSTPGCGTPPHATHCGSTGTSTTSAPDRCRGSESPTRPWPRSPSSSMSSCSSDVAGTLVGFRFPDYAQGINVAGYHLHFVSDDRARGGHVLDCRLRSGVVAIDHSSELHVELPVGVDAAAPDATAEKRALLDQIEDGA